MKNILSSLLISGLMLMLVQPGHAQLGLPDKSPTSTLTQKAGFTNIAVTYARPSARGRKVFGGLVPYNELWRTGASNASTISFSEDVVIEENKVPKGTYTLFTIPGQEEWTIILNKDTVSPGTNEPMHGTDDYKESSDLCRFKVKPDNNMRFTESFTIEIGDIGQNNAVVYLRWENTEVKFKVVTDADDRVMAEINQRIVKNKEEGAGVYFQSGLYYFENGKDMKQALEWVKIAIAKDERINYLHVLAKIHAKLGDRAAAIAAAQRSLQLAKEKSNKNYINLNEKLIAELEKQK